MHALVCVGALIDLLLKLLTLSALCKQCTCQLMVFLQEGWKQLCRLQPEKDATTSTQLEGGHAYNYGL